MIQRCFMFVFANMIKVKSRNDSEHWNRWLGARVLLLLVTDDLQSFQLKLWGVSVFQTFYSNK